MPYLCGLRAENKLQQGVKEISIRNQGKKYKYIGELDYQQNACGLGQAEDNTGRKFTGLFLNNQPHGICK